MIQESEPRNMAPSKAIYNCVEQSFISEKLKGINVTCQQVDDRVDNVLKCLVGIGMPLDEIRIQQKNILSECKFSILHSKFFFVSAFYSFIMCV